MHDLIPLNCVPVGSSAQVQAVMGQPELVHRLREMGLTDGQQIEMLQSGSPCIIRLGGHKLCFRCNDLTRVLVKLEDPS